jgi:hypothetical protein
MCPALLRGAWSSVHTPCGDLPTLHLAHHLAVGDVDQRQLARPARADHASACRRPSMSMQSGPDWGRAAVHRGQACIVDHADGVGHAVADEHVPPSPARAEGVRALAGGDASCTSRAPCRRPRRTPRRSGRRSGRAAGACRHRREEHVGRHLADLDLPARAPAWPGRWPAARRCLAALDHGGAAVDPQVAGRLAGGNALDQLQRVGPVAWAASGRCRRGSAGWRR